MPDEPFATAASPCGHAIRTHRYDDLSACHLREGHEGDHTDGYYAWHVRVVAGITSEPARSVRRD